MRAVVAFPHLIPSFLPHAWYDVSHAMRYRVWGKNLIKKSLTLLDN